MDHHRKRRSKSERDKHRQTDAISKGQQSKALTEKSLCHFSVMAQQLHTFFATAKLRLRASDAAASFHLCNQWRENPTVITKNRLTMRLGLFNQAKHSKTVCRPGGSDQQQKGMTAGTLRQQPGQSHPGQGGGPVTQTQVVQAVVHHSIDDLLDTPPALAMASTAQHHTTTTDTSDHRLSSCIARDTTDLPQMLSERKDPMAGSGLDAVSDTYQLSPLNLAEAASYLISGIDLKSWFPRDEDQFESIKKRLSESYQKSCRPVPSSTQYAGLSSAESLALCGGKTSQTVTRHTVGRGSGQSVSEIIESYHRKHQQQAVQCVSNSDNTAYHGRPVMLLSNNDVAYQRHPAVANDHQQTSSQPGRYPLAPSPRGPRGPPPWRLPDGTDCENDANCAHLPLPQGQHGSSAQCVSGKMVHSEQELRQSGKGSHTRAVVYDETGGWSRPSQHTSRRDITHTAGSEMQQKRCAAYGSGQERQPLSELGSNTYYVPQETRCRQQPVTAMEGLLSQDTVRSHHHHQHQHGGTVAASDNTAGDSATRWFTDVGVVSRDQAHQQSGPPSSDGSWLKNLAYSQGNWFSDGPIHNSSQSGSQSQRHSVWDKHRVAQNSEQADYRRIAQDRGHDRHRQKDSYFETKPCRDKEEAMRMEYEYLPRGLSQSDQKRSDFRSDQPRSFVYQSTTVPHQKAVRVENIVEHQQPVPVQLQQHFSGSDRQSMSSKLYQSHPDMVLAAQRSYPTVYHQGVPVPECCLPRRSEQQPQMSGGMVYHEAPASQTSGAEGSQRQHSKPPSVCHHSQILANREHDILDLIDSGCSGSDENTLATLFGRHKLHPNEAATQDCARGPADNTNYCHTSPQQARSTTSSPILCINFPPPTPEFIPRPVDVSSPSPSPYSLPFF